MLLIMETTSTTIRAGKAKRIHPSRGAPRLHPDATEQHHHGKQECTGLHEKNRDQLNLPDGGLIAGRGRHRRPGRRSSRCSSSLDQHHREGGRVWPYTRCRTGRGDVYLREGCYLLPFADDPPCAPRRALRQTIRPAASSSTTIRSSGAPSAPVPTCTASAASYSDEWHRVHLMNPRDVVPESNMPAYPWLEKRRQPRHRQEDGRLRRSAVGVPYSDDDIAKAADEVKGKTARCLADRLSAGDGHRRFAQPGDPAIHRGCAVTRMRSVMDIVNDLRRLVTVVHLILFRASRRGGNCPAATARPSRRGTASLRFRSQTSR